MYRFCNRAGGFYLCIQLFSSDHLVKVSMNPTSARNAVGVVSALALAAQTIFLFRVWKSSSIHQSYEFQHQSTSIPIGPGNHGTSAINGSDPHLTWHEFDVIVDGSEPYPIKKCTIISHDTGRLGNQLYQYATMYLLARIHGKQPCMSTVGAQK